MKIYNIQPHMERMRGIHICMIVLGVFLFGFTFFSAVPHAEAAITAGGATCTNTSTSAGTSLACTVSTQSLEAGNIGVLLFGTDETASLSDGNTRFLNSVTDSKGNSWQVRQCFANAQTSGTASDGAVTCIATSRITTTLTTSDTITSTFTSATAKAVVVREFIVGANKDLEVVGAIQQLANDAADPGNMTINVTNGEYLYVRSTALERNTTTWTQTTNFTSIPCANANTGSTLTSMNICGEYRIFTGTSMSSNPTATAVDNASLFIAFQEVDISVTPTAATCANNSTASNATLSCTLGSQENIDAGNVAVMLFATNNTATADDATQNLTSVTDSGGNAWTVQQCFTNGQGGAAAGATVCVATSKISTTLTASASTITANYLSSAAKSFVVHEFVVPSGYILGVVGTTQTLANDGADPGNMSISGLTGSSSTLFLRATASERNVTTWVSSYNYTSAACAMANTGTAGTSMNICGEYRIYNAVGASSDPAGTAVDNASLFVAFRPVIALEGTLYLDEGVTLATTTKYIAVSTASGMSTTTTNAGGSWLVRADNLGLSAGTPFSVRTYNDPTTRAALFSRASGAVPQSGLNLYKDHVIMRHEDSGPLTFANIATSSRNAAHNSSGDTTLPYYIDQYRGRFYTKKDVDLYIQSGDTYTGATSTILGGDIKNNGTLNLTAGTTSLPVDAQITGNAVNFGNVITGSSTDREVVTGTHWIPASTPSLLHSWQGVTYGEGLFVAVACGISVDAACNATAGGSRVMTSPDGITWTGRNASQANEWRKVAYGEGRFVAVAPNGTNRVMTSEDGTTWTNRTAASAQMWASVAYGEGRFVALSYDGTAMYSDDGLTWSSGTASGNGIYQVMYNEAHSQFVAVGDNRVATSPDGITWTNRTAAQNNWWNGIAYGNGTYVAVSSLNAGTHNVMTSPDAITWTPRSATHDGSWLDVTFTGEYFVAIGYGDLAEQAMISTDGINWTAVDEAESAQWESITYGDGKVVAINSDGANRAAVADGGFLASVSNFENDGVTWTARTAGGADQWSSVTYGEGIFVAVSYEWSIMTSSDGINWQYRLPSDGGSWQSVTYGDGMFVAVSNNGSTNRIMTSPDGINWTPRAAVAANTWQSITYGNGLFVAVACGVSATTCNSTGGGSRVMTSPDGITWTGRTASEAAQWMSVTYANNLFVAVAQSGTNRVMTSPDGITWTGRSAASANAWQEVTFGEGLFVAVGETDSLMTSPDGITWTSRSAAGNSDWYSVAYGGGLFVARGDILTGSARLMTSPNGITWTERTPAETNFSIAVTYGEGKFVSVQQDGTSRVHTSDSGAYANADISFTANATTTDLTITASSSVTNAARMSITDDLTNNGDFEHSTGTVRFHGSNAQTIAGELVGTSTFNNVMFSGNSTKTFSNNASTSNFAIASGATVVAPSSLTISGGYTNSGTFTKGSGLVYIDGIGTTTFSGTMTGSSAFNDVSLTSESLTNDGITWTARSASQNNSWQSLVYANGLFVAVSNGGTNNVMTSPDGITWTARVSADETAGWNAVTYGNGLFVAVAESGTNRVMTSPDGVTWTARSASQANTWYDVTYGNGTFVAVSVDGTNRVMTSPDGITWTNRTAASASQWSTVTYGNSLFVALSWDNTIMTSSDGITWTTRTSIPTFGSWHGIVYAEGLFVGVGNGTAVVMTSPDGISWTERTGLANNWDSVTHSGTTFVAVACGIGTGNCNTTAGGNRVMTSPDGITWTGTPATEANRWMKVVYGNGTLVAVADSGTNRVMISTSTSWSGGVVFSNNASTTDLSISSVSRMYAPSKLSIAGDYTNNGIFEAGTGTTTLIGNDQTLSGSMVDGSAFNDLVISQASGSDTAGGVTWVDHSEITDANTTVLSAITYGEGKFVAVGYNGYYVMTSQDGVTWTPHSAAGDDDTWLSVAYGNGRFVAVGQNLTSDVVMSSEDGIAWTARSAAGNNDDWASVTYGNGLFVAVGWSGDRVMTSPDGITWTARTAAEANSWSSVTYGNGLFVAVSSDGTNRVMTSPDGITWTARSSSEANNWFAVTYGDGLFVAVAGSGTNRVMTSPDGITWTARSASEANGWYAVTYGDGQFVAVSSDGTNRVMTSPDGITWTARSTPGVDDDLYWVAYGNGKFVAVGWEKILTSDSGSREDGTVRFSTPVEADSLVSVTPGVYLEFPAHATSTFASIRIDGEDGGETFLRSSREGTQWGLDVTTPISVTYVDVQDSNACPSTNDLTATSSIDSGNNDCWTFPVETVGASISSASNQSFILGQATTSIATITITDGSPATITAANDIRIVIDSSRTNMEWDTTDTTATFGGTASSKVGNPVSYENGGKTLVVPVSSNFAVGDTLTISGLSFLQFTATSSATSTLGLGTSGALEGGVTWTARTAAEANGWYSITYGNGQFVAIAGSGTNRIMTSPDGITWTARSAAPASSWGSVSITYGEGLFVAVGDGGTDRVMTSPDGITWTGRTAAEANTWNSVTYGEGIFVAVASDGTNRVMTSPDGITWTSRNASEATFWYAVTYGNGQFVAISFGGTNRVMTSPDGITWTGRTAAQANEWMDVAYGNGLYVAVARTGTNRVMTSPDGITWTARNAAQANSWYALEYGDGTFVATASDGTNRVMTSPDGITWTARNAAQANSWYNVGYGENLFVAISDSGTNRVMTSPSISGLVVARDDKTIAIAAASSVSISSASNQTFTLNQATTSIATITITDASPATITAANDIRIVIATTTTSMKWDTTDTTAVFGGTASGKVSNPVSYAGNGSILIIPVSNDFSADDTLTVSGLSFAQFGALRTATTALSMRLDGAADTSPNDVDDKTITITGSLAVANHDAGQATNAFSFQNQTATPLYRFKMTPAGENITVPTMTFNLNGVRKINANKLSELQLYRDVNNNGVYNAGTDVQVGGSGALSIQGQSGSIVFSSSFSATTSQNYIVIGNTTAIKPADAMTISFNVAGTVTGATSLGSITPTGSVTSVQHSRSAGAANGGSGAIGGDAPAGNGTQTGGTSGGGGGVGEEDNGQTIGNEPGFQAPAATGESFNEWTNGSEAYSSNNVYATAASTNLRQSYSLFGFNVPPGNTVQGIEVKLEASGSTAAGTIQVALSWNGGSSVTATKATSVLTGSDAVYTLGGPADTWGRGWTPTELGNANFVVRIIGQPNNNTVRVDAIQVKPYHQTGGGSSGGGGEI